MLRLKIIESDRYYTTLRRLGIIGFVGLLFVFPAMWLDLPDGFTAVILVLALGGLLYQIRLSLNIRNDTERRRLEVDERGITIRHTETKEAEHQWPWSALSRLELRTDNNLAEPSLAQSKAIFTGEELANYLAFHADGTAYRYDFLLESDYAERRLRALVEAAMATAGSGDL